MARLSLDNFPQPQSGWKDWHKFALIGLTIGIALVAWHFITKANEAKKLAKVKMAESEAMLKVAELEKTKREQATAAVTGHAIAAAINHITHIAVQEAQNPQNTEGVEPFTEVKTKP